MQILAATANAACTNEQRVRLGEQVLGTWGLRDKVGTVSCAYYIFGRGGAFTAGQVNCSGQMPRSHPGSWSIDSSCGFVAHINGYPDLKFGNNLEKNGLFRRSVQGSNSQNPVAKSTYYAISASEISQQQAENIASTFGAPWRIVSTEVCKKYTQDLWIMGAPASDKNSASALAAKVKGYAKQCL